MPRRAGGMGLGTIAALEALLVSIALLPGALLCSAADDNGPGDRFADRHRSLGEKFRIPSARLHSPIEGGRLERRPARRIRNERSEAMTMLDATGMSPSRAPGPGRAASHPATPI